MKHFLSKISEKLFFPLKSHKFSFVDFREMIFQFFFRIFEGKQTLRNIPSANFSPGNTIEWSIVNHEELIINDLISFEHRIFNTSFISRQIRKIWIYLLLLFEIDEIWNQDEYNFSERIKHYGKITEDKSIYKTQAGSLFYRWFGQLFKLAIISLQYIKNNFLKKGKQFKAVLPFRPLADQSIFLAGHEPWSPLRLYLLISLTFE